MASGSIVQPCSCQRVPEQSTLPAIATDHDHHPVPAWSAIAELCDLQALRHELRQEVGGAGNVSAWSREAGNGGDGLTAVKEDDRDVRGCTLGRKGPGRPIGEEDALLPTPSPKKGTRGRGTPGIGRAVGALIGWSERIVFEEIPNGPRAAQGICKVARGSTFGCRRFVPMAPCPSRDRRARPGSSGLILEEMLTAAATRRSATQWRTSRPSGRTRRRRTGRRAGRTRASARP